MAHAVSDLHDDDGLGRRNFTTTEAILGAFASLMLFYPVMLLVPIAVKWIVIGRYRPGAYPLWGWFYFRWWLATTMEAGRARGLPGRHAALQYLSAADGREDREKRASGLRRLRRYDLLAIGDDSSINADSNLPGYTVENGWLKIGRVTIGRRCFVGARAALRLDTVMEDDSALEDLSLLPRGGVIPRGQTWLGSPARPAPAARRRRRVSARRGPAVRFRNFAWPGRADFSGAGGGGAFSRHRGDE